MGHNTIVKARAADYLALKSRQALLDQVKANHQLEGMTADSFCAALHETWTKGLITFEFMHKIIESHYKNP